MFKPRLAAAVGLSTALLGAAVTAQAAETVRVDGGHFAEAGLERVTQGCADPASEPQNKPTFVVRRGPDQPPLGEYSAGWQMAGTTFGSGVRVMTASPSTLDTFNIDINAPDGTVRGAAVVTYQAPNDAGIWKGTADLGTDTTAGWHTVSALNLTYSWLHYTDGAYDGTAPRSSLPGFVLGHGGDGNGASVGFIFGCDGHPFFVDAFSVGSGDAVRTFDLDGVATSARMYVGKRSPSSITIKAGRGVALGAKLLTQIDRKRTSGTVGFQRATPGKDSWATFDRGRSTPKRMATTTVHPTKATSYRVTYGGSGGDLGSTSRDLLVRVRFGVAAHFADSSIKKGAKYAVSGKVRPGKRTTVRLQQKVHNKWRTVKTTKATGHGVFKFSGAAPGVGKTTYRVLVSGASGTLGAHSKNLTLKVIKPVVHHSGGGGGGSTGGGGGTGGGTGGGGGGGGDPEPPGPPGPEG